MNCIQLYNEKIYDMMDNKDRAEKRLRWNARDQFIVQGIKTVSVSSSMEAL